MKRAEIFRSFLRKIIMVGVLKGSRYFPAGLCSVFLLTPKPIKKEKRDV